MFEERLFGGRLLCKAGFKYYWTRTRSNVSWDELNFNFPSKLDKKKPLITFSLNIRFGWYADVYANVSAKSRGVLSSYGVINEWCQGHVPGRAISCVWPWRTRKNFVQFNDLQLRVHTTQIIMFLLLFDIVDVRMSRFSSAGKKCRKEMSENYRLALAYPRGGERIQFENVGVFVNLAATRPCLQLWEKQTSINSVKKLVLYSATL